MSTKVSFLLVAAAILLLPWLVWRMPVVRRVAPLAVVQIMIGVLLGPSLLAQLAPQFHAALFTRPVMASIDGVASLGVLLYVFVTGLHLDTGAIGQDVRRLWMAACGSVLVPLVLGAAAGWWMLHATPDALGSVPNHAAFIAAVAICVAVTALPVLAAVLQEMGLLASRLGQSALVLAAMNDAALWVMLASLLAFANGHYAAGAASLCAAAALFATLLRVVRPWLNRLAGTEDRTLLVVCLTLAIVVACLSEALGTGYLIGAFIAGTTIPAGFRPRLLAQLELVTATVFLPFFFMSTGLKAYIEPASASFLALLAVAVAATVAGKLVGTAIPAVWSGYRWRDSIALGIMMQTKGLMEVVVLSVLNDAGLMSRGIFSAMVAMAVICTIITAPLVRLCAWIGNPGKAPVMAERTP